MARHYVPIQASIPPPSNPTERLWLGLAAGLLILSVLPYIWLGEDAYLTIHDNLDSDFLYLRLLSISRTAFDFDLQTVIPNVMDGSAGGQSALHGVPRSAFRTGLNLEVFTFYVLPPYVAMVVNLVLIRAIGFLGMYGLLRNYVLPEADWALTRVAVAFLFAFVPSYVVHGASVSGQPLLLLAFLNLLNRPLSDQADRRKAGSWTDWLIIGLFPFYSFFVWAGLFIIVALALIGLVVMFRQRRISWPYVGGLTLLTGVYLATEWQMIYSFLAKTYVSQRTEYDYARLLPVSVVDSLRRSAQLFAQTYYHSGSFVTLGIIAVAALAGLRAYRQERKKQWQTIALLIGGAGLICLFSGFYRFPAIWLGPGNLLQAFQFDRFYFLLPTLWFILFALALREFGSRNWLNRLFLAGQLAVMLAANKELIVNVTKLAGYADAKRFPSYRAFYAPRQFAAIRAYIGQPSSAYRVVSIGMHPAVALYNGFYALDSYQNNYRLSYKHAFRRVIASELAKAPAIQTYYDAYGCRCYTYSAELGMTPESFLCGKQSGRSISQLQLNTAALSALGGRYVLSAVPIRNAGANKLTLEKIFNDADSYWRVWLYRVALPATHDVGQEPRL